MCLYAGEAAATSLLVGLYRITVYDWGLFSARAGALLVAGGIGLIASGWVLALQIKSSASVRAKALTLGFTTNLLTILIAFLLSEGIVRMFARSTPEGIVVGRVVLRPTWHELLAQSRQVLAGNGRQGSWDESYIVYDSHLGWTVGPNRRSRDGLYFSSVEGIRSSGPNVSMAAETPRFRVALVGDSNAFSLEVPFEESWGYHLQRLLGHNVQVLNFGVDGYGIDQMYLRYKRDVRPWKPKVVVLGFIQHDLKRTMAVYPFVSFGWPGFLVKPRFVAENELLKLLNVPLPTPQEILSARRIEQLPYVEYDLGYGTTDWSWRFEHGPFFLRFLTSAFPRWRTVDPRVSAEAAKTLNSRLLVDLMTVIQKDGATTLLVDLTGREASNPVAEAALVRARAPVLDMTDCLARVPAKQRRVPSGHHFTGVANLAIAGCTAQAIGLARGIY